MRAAQYFASLMTLSAFLLPATSWSEDSGYQFNVGAPVKAEFKKSIEFKNPSEDEKNKKLDMVKEAENKSLYATSVDYPKSEIYFSFNPGIDGVTNTYSNGRAYNYGGNNFTGMSGGYIYSPSIENYLTVDLTYSSISVPNFSDTAAGLIVNASNSQMLDIAIGFNFCQVYESTYHRLCPGVEIDYDSFSTLSFPTTNNTQLNLSSIQDMTVGVNLAYTQRLGQSFEMLSKISYNYGLDAGQSSSLGTQSDQKITGRLGIERSLSARWYWSIILGVDYRTATLKSSQDTWKVQDLAYNAKLGLKYEFGNSLF